ncbi:MAG TPA: DNA repair protein RadA [Longimicrobiales bacterium]
MAKTRTIFFCTECGNESPRWQGQCPACSAWNTLVEEPVAPRNKKSAASPSRSTPSQQAARLSDLTTQSEQRWPTGIDEFDFVLGGGVVPGSLILVGGEPGIGKSTLLLQVAARLAASGRRALYISGEESGAQVRLRADRLLEDTSEVLFLGETDLARVLAQAEEHAPAVLFVDSIQTTYTEDIEGAPGNVGQVRECAARLQRFAKENGVTVFLVGHVTKGGTVAGPKTLEHIVDTVLYFEDSGSLDHRVLRATKNRFGGVDEIGVFRMSAQGLTPVGNPSELFLHDRNTGVSGSAVLATIEGTRPLLVEVQALCTKASYGAPQRVVTGFDRQRLALLLAVLEQRANIPFGQLDVFLNVVGGVQIDEPAGDLAVVAALASAVLNRSLPPTAVFIGEVGLGGELRAVSQIERRLSEAARMGFTHAYVPQKSAPRGTGDGLSIVGVRDVQSLSTLLAT